MPQVELETPSSTEENIRKDIDVRVRARTFLKCSPIPCLGEREGIVDGYGTHWKVDELTNGQT